MFIVNITLELSSSLNRLIIVLQYAFLVLFYFNNHLGKPNYSNVLNIHKIYGVVIFSSGRLLKDHVAKSCNIVLWN